MLRIWTEAFVLWVVIFSALAYLYPPLFAWFRPFIVPGLGVIMFGMGMTLVPADFARVARMPRAVLCGVIGQFIIMPVAAWGLAKTFGLGPELAMGFIILGACPGGTASNVIAYLARADVALSVTMTAASTLLAIVLTPLLIGGFGGEFLPVDRWGLFMNVVKIVLVPVTAGFAVRAMMKDRLKTVLDVFPAISVLFIVLIIACIVALRADDLAVHALPVIGIAVIHNALGLSLGYGLATLFRLPVKARRTIAVEVGMQNSGLGMALATTHYAGTLAALPSAVFSVLHNLTGSAAATWWRRTAPKEDAP